MNLIRFLFRYSPRFVLLSALIGVAGGFASTAVLTIINEHLRGVAQGENVGLFITLCFVILFANLIARLLIAGLSQWSAFDLRLQLGRLWIKTPLRELETKGAGRLMSAVTNDVARLADSMQILPGLCIDIAVIASCLVYLGYLSWWMLLVLIVFIVFVLVTRHYPQSKCDQLLRQAHGHGEQMMIAFNALLSGIKELKMNRRRWSGFYTGELYEASSKFRDKHYKAELIFGFVRGYSEIIYFMFVGILIFLAAGEGRLSMEVVIGFSVTLLYMKTNIDHILGNIALIKTAQVALANLNSLGVVDNRASITLSGLQLRASREALSEKLAEDAMLRDDVPPVIRKELVLKGVAYNYEGVVDESKFAVEPIDLTIQANELLFVIGGNGSGKTTFGKILCGLYSPTAGTIEVDGTVIDDENRAWYSQHFAAVFSDSYLFDKLYDYGGLACDERLVAEYLRELRLEDKVSIVQGRFSTTALSQGQRKRLALLTAYMENRPLYLFDEWAADQDPEFREFFYRTILKRLKAEGKTIIVITHDDRYFDTADRILKFDFGKMRPYRVDAQPKIANAVAAPQPT